MHPAAISIERLTSECEFTRTRRSGPGGQHRNKVESAVVIRHIPTGVIAEANERRSQADNKREAIFRLRVNLALAVRSQNQIANDKSAKKEDGNVESPPKNTTFDGPSQLWRNRFPGERLLINPRHDDFPAILSEALDRIENRRGDVSASAEDLDTTSSQLVKLLKLDSRAFELLNRKRQKLGLKILK